MSPCSALSKVKGIQRPMLCPSGSSTYRLIPLFWYLQPDEEWAVANSSDSQLKRLGFILAYADYYFNWVRTGAPSMVVRRIQHLMTHLCVYNLLTTPPTTRTHFYLCAPSWHTLFLLRCKRCHGIFILSHSRPDYALFCAWVSTLCLHPFLLIGLHPVPGHFCVARLIHASLQFDTTWHCARSALSRS